MYFIIGFNWSYLIVFIIHCCSYVLLLYIEDEVAIHLITKKEKESIGLTGGWMIDSNLRETLINTDLVLVKL